MHEISDVIERGMCVGCGACNVVTGGKVPISLAPIGAYQADISGLSARDYAAANKVCPFSDASRNESEIAHDLFPGQATDDRIGAFTGLYAARVESLDYLVGSSSGGLTSWIAEQLLKRDYIDAVIHVGASSGSDLFAYQISRTIDQLHGKRKSAYYSTTFSEALAEVRATPGRYALMGVPCVARGARLVAENDDVIRERLAYVLGLVCGHLKTRGFAESLGWQVGVSPERLGSVDFRIKNPGQSSAHYDFGARAVDGSEMLRAPTPSLVGGDWGHGMFQLEACNFCDDIFAETADIAFGDAWLPEYKAQWEGTNVIVTRRAELDALLTEAAADGEIMLSALTADQIAQSQDGNFRHRRMGLAVRLQDDIRAGLSVPRKRVDPGYAGVPARRIALIRQRRAMSRQSIRAFEEAKRRGSLEFFLGAMQPMIDRYRQLDARTLKSRIVLRVRRVLRWLQVS